MTRALRIFISSPGDVAAERLRAQLIIQKLGRDYARFFDISAYLWEHEPMLASGHFQDAIRTPSECDIVVLIVYSRLGTPLPEQTELRTYAGIDGRHPVTGTEWEFEEALNARRTSGAPDLLAYRRVGDPGASLTDASRRAEQIGQFEALEAFWKRHFEDRGIFLAGSARYDSLADFDRKLEGDLKALIERRIAAATVEAAAPGRAPTWLTGSPFRGLAAYEFEHAPVFFGREADTRDALGRLQEAGLRGHGSLLIVGASGSGKSSLARAGLLPALVAPHTVESVGHWRRAVMRPGQAGDDPIRALVTALIEGDAEQGVGLPELAAGGVDVADLVRHMRMSADEPSLPIRSALGAIAASRKAAGLMLAHEQVRLVLLVDQLEELVTLPGILPDDRALFVRIVSGLVRSGMVWVIGTLRSDFWHAAAAVPRFVDFVEAGARIDLSLPDGGALIELIRQPATAAGLSFGIDPDTRTGLDATLAGAAAREAGSLPLLSVMLDTLYARDIAGASPPSSVLRVETYRALGELKGAIAERAEEVLSRLRESDPPAAEALPELLRALVTVGEHGAAITSRAAPLAQFAEGTAERRLVDALVAADARLLIAESHGEQTVVRVAHEALIANWPRAVEQLQRDRRDIETRARLEALLEGWRSAAARDKSQALLTGLPLAEGVDLARRWKLPSGTAMAGFIAESARRARWRRVVVVAAIIICVVALGAGGFGWVALDQQRQAAAAREVADAATRAAGAAKAAADAEARRAKDADEAARRQTELRQIAQDNEAKANEARRAALVTEANRIAALAQQLLNDDNVTLSAAVALSAAPADASDARPMTAALATALRRSIEAAPLPIERNVGENAFSLAASPDGRVIAVGTVKGAVHVFDSASMIELFRFSIGTDVVSSLSFSADGEKLLATGDKVPVVWSVSRKQKLFDLTRPDLRKYAKTARFSPDGSRIIVSTAENRALLHDATDGKLLFVLPGSTSEEMQERFTRNSGITPDPLALSVSQTIHAIFGAATDVAFSPDGRLAAVTGQANADASVRLYDVETGKLVRILAGGEGTTHVPAMAYDDTLAFSSDGSSLIASPIGSSIKVWDIRDGRLKVDLPSPGGGTFIITADGRAVLSGHRNGTIVARCIERAVLSSIQAHASEIEVLVSDAAGGLMISGARDRTARVWRFPTGAEICSGESTFSLQRPLATFAGHGARVSSAAFTDQLGSVVTTSQDGIARKWRLRPADAMRFAVQVRDEDATLPPAEADMRDSIVVSADSRRVFLKLESKWFGFQLASGRPIDISEQPRLIVPGAPGKPPLLFFAPTRSYPLGAVPTDAAPASGLDETQIIAFPGGASPDGSRVVVTSLGDDEKPDRLIDSRTGEAIAVLGLADKRAVNYAFAADGSRLAAIVAKEQLAMDHCGLAVWDARSGALVASLDEIRDLATFDALQVSADGTRVLVYSEDAGARVFAIADGKMTSIVLDDAVKHGGGLRMPSKAVLAPDGRTLLVGYDDGAVAIVDLDTGKFRLIEGLGAPIKSMAMAPDNRHFAVADASNTLRIFDPSRPEPLHELPRRDGVVALRFTPDGQRLIVGDDKFRFEVLSEGNLPLPLEPLRKTNVPRQIELADRDLRFDAVVSGDGRHFFLRHNGYASDWFAIDLQSGKALEIGRPGAIAPGAPGKPALLFYGPTQAFEPDKIPDNAAEPDRVDDLDIRGGAVAPDGSRIVVGASGDDKPDRLIDARTGAELAILSRGGRRADAYYFSADSTRLFARTAPGGDAKEHGLAVWDARSGALVASLEAVKDFTSDTEVLLSADGAHVLLFGDKQLRAFVVADGRIYPLPFGDTETGSRRDRKITAVALAPDGRSLTAGHSDGYVSIVGLGPLGRIERSFDTRGFAIARIAVAPDGRHFAVVDRSATVWIFDRDQAMALRSITRRERAELLRFTPDSRSLIIGDSSNAFEVLPLTPGIAGLDSPQDIVDWARAVRLAAIDEEDQRRYGLLSFARTDMPTNPHRLKVAPDAPRSALPLAPGPKAAACDKAAADPSDRNARRDPGVAFEAIDVTVALPACREAAIAFPEDPVTAYQLARVHRRAGNVEEALKGLLALSDKGYAAASREIARLVGQDGSGRLAARVGTVEVWIDKASAQGDRPAITERVTRLAIGVDARARTAEVLSGLGFMHRPRAALATFRLAADAAQSNEQKANALYFGLLGLELDVIDAAALQDPADLKRALERVRELAAALPPPVVVQAYRDARAWRAPDGMK